MDSKAVSKEIRGRAWPLLKAAGFSRFTTRTAWRDSGGKVDVFSFPSYNAYNASVLEVTPFSFSVNLGSFLTYVPPRWPPKAKDGHLMPDEAECQFRCRLPQTITQPGNKYDEVFSVDAEGRNLLWCIQDVAEQLPDALAWFARLRDRSEVLRILCDEDEDMNVLSGVGRRPSPVRSYLSGYVALSLGQKELAREKLQEAVQSNCFKTLFSSVDGAVNRAA